MRGHTPYRLHQDAPKDCSHVTLVNAPCEEGIICSAPDTEPCASNVGRWVLVAMILGSSMAFVNASVVNVALPALQQELQATVMDVQWVVNASMLLLAALILFGAHGRSLYSTRQRNSYQ